MSTARSAGGRTIASQRAVSMTLSVAIHGLVIGLAVLAVWQPPDASEREIFTSIQLSPTASQAEEPQPPRAEPQPSPSPVPTLVPPLPVLPTELLAPPAPPVPAAVIALLADADAQAAGGACDLTAPVQAALRLDPEVQRLLPSIPPSRRSVAMAISLWNRAWISPDTGLDAIVLGAIRSTVAATVEAASPACRSQIQSGPRLVYLPGTTDTVLALGSGQWTWQDVADTARPSSPDTAMPDTVLEKIAPRSLTSP